MYPLQSRTPGPKYVAFIVAVHVVFAFLEKRRIENFEAQGEVISAFLVVPGCVRALQL